MRVKRIGLAAVVAVMLIGGQSAVWAGCGTCQVCKEGLSITLTRDYCKGANSEDGWMCCREESFGLETFCYESGSACYGITVGGGGGGGGTGGGGGGCASTGGFCPAECFSCSGGGGGVY